MSVSKSKSRSVLANIRQLCYTNEHVWVGDLVIRRQARGVIREAEHSLVYHNVTVASIVFSDFTFCV